MRTLDERRNAVIGDMIQLAAMAFDLEGGPPRKEALDLLVGGFAALLDDAGFSRAELAEAFMRRGLIEMDNRDAH